MYFDYIQLPLLQDLHLPPQPLPTLFSLSLCLLILICEAHIIIELELSTEEASSPFQGQHPDSSFPSSQAAITSLPIAPQLG